MLDSETKRRIDTARDILVGKVPDPKSQVEQITIALIYKFMDDMDAQAEELGGKRKFFIGEYAAYGWAKLMAPSVSGDERIALYADGMVKMTQNPGVPALFRNIFKNAFLPYRDPETLKSFLKTIDEFEYDHSERLGDAFEYLLSVLGSQGQAGQFRTPRHIIDFIVSVVDPKKTETVLDPACGTAGFMISAYKHILRANSTPSAIAKVVGDSEAALHTSKIPPAKGDLLTPDERKKLADNFRGYDISPDMVRLSLVNMYLHGFTDPHIFEYDTLTSQDRWNEMADVILANPPFMSPKGGIKPHNRFSVSSKRSEVLFVDYMAEHLTPGGRAGIIVPEGIIFQSQTAYKALRKMLVEQYLVAVVSLPAGVFNPYSGVKTSILILDKSLAKQSDTVGFFKVENDGFNLGAQRRPIDKNDLPQVLAEIEEYLQRLRAKESVAAEDFTTTCGLIVAKEKIAANGDFNLKGERYRDNRVRSSNYPMVPIGEVCELFNGRAFKPEDWEKPESGGIPIVRIQNLNNPESEFNYFTGEASDKNLIAHGELLFSWSGSRGTSFGAHIWKGEKAVLNQHIFKVGNDENRTTKMYLLHALNKAVEEVEENLHGGVGLVHITKGNLERIEIPLPPLDVQKEIVAEIEAYQKVIDGARAVLDHYSPHIPINAEWPMVALGSVVEDMHQGINTAGLKIEFSDHGFPIIQSRNITSGMLDFKNIKYMSTDDWITYRDKYKPQIGDVLFTNIGTIGKSIIVTKDEDYLIHWNIFIIKSGSRLDPKFLKTYLDYLDGIQYFTNMQRGGTVQFVSKKQLSDTQIALPPLAAQREIVAEIEAEQRLVEGNRQLIERMEQKIVATLARIWGDESASDPTQNVDPELAHA
jgi:type I restriction enzyme M protein